MKYGNWEISLKSVIKIQWKKSIPRLVIHEKYEKFLKWFLRLITIFSILTSLIIFPARIYALIVSILLVVFEQFFERVIFEYTAIYITPMPNFEILDEEWKGMGFAMPKNLGPGDLNVVGPTFASKEYAHKFFDLLRSWNYNKKIDKENNICISFIIENPSLYSAYLYPNRNRSSVNGYFQMIESSDQYRKEGKQLQKLIMQMEFCKRLPYSKDSKLYWFINNQPKNMPFWLQPFILNKNGETQLLLNEQPILKYYFKFKKRIELNHDDLEYHHGKEVLKIK
jgi:hypothetical protein